MTTITLPRATVEQALEALIIAWQQQPRWQITESMHNLRAALAQQAEPVAGNTLLKAFLAAAKEAGVTHIRQAEADLRAALAQQAEPAETFLITGNEFCGAPPAPYATWGDALAGMLDAGKIEGLRISALAQQAWVCPESPEHRYPKPGHCEDCGKPLVLAHGIKE